MNRVKCGVVVLVLFMSTMAMAQKKKHASGTQLGIGAELALPVGDFGKGRSTGFGGSAKFDFPLFDGGAATLSGGLISYSSKASGLKALNIVPVKAGLKFRLDGDLYAEPQLGVSFLSNNGGSAFTYAANLGYKLTSSFDVAARYEAFSKSSITSSFIGLRLAYNFGL